MGDVELVVAGGRVEPRACDADAAPAQLSWPAGTRVLRDGVPVEGTTCEVTVETTIDVELEQTAPTVRYVIDVSDDAMEATLRVEREPGVSRSLQDAAASARLTLVVLEEPIEHLTPSLEDAWTELEQAGVTFGVLDDEVEAAVDVPGSPRVVARGVAPIEGAHGYLEQLVEIEQLRLVGVPAGTDLVHRISRQEGAPGTDVRGRALPPAPTHEAPLRAGQGATLDAAGDLATATVDGSPRLDVNGLVEVHHVLELAEVDTTTGSLAFLGSVHVSGSVHEGRTLVAGGSIIIDGNVDRGRIDSGGDLEVKGSIMSSVLRAGAERAVAAAIADRILDLPQQLAVIREQAAQLRRQAAARGRAMGHGLAVQVVLERLHPRVLKAIGSIADELAGAGEAHARVASRARTWHRTLATSANQALTEHEYACLAGEVAEVVADVRRALDNPANLVVAYMQASEAEATGTVTVTGKGIFNSRIVAAGGLDAQRFEAVLRGGSVTSNGRVHVAEVGSPAGARTDVKLGRGATLEADRAYAGTVVSGPGYTHRFEADRTHVRIGFDSTGAMNVESLAA